MNILLPLGGLALGGAVGYGFGALQNAALLRNKKSQERGTPKSGLLIMPGSAGRVAMLLLVLAVVQVVCPLFFEETRTQWMVSAGVVIGYGWTLIHKLRHYSTYQS